MIQTNSPIDALQLKIGPFGPHFYNYIKLVDNENIPQALEMQLQKLEAFFNSIPEEQSLYKYAEGKWTLKEVLQHIIDSERIFAYRALAFARKDKNPLPSFDENEYAANSHANSRSWKDLTEEFLVVRKSTLLLFNSFSEEDFKSVGIASNSEISVRAMAYIIIGHARHHNNLIKERYLV